jgi:protein TonB
MTSPEKPRPPVVGDLVLSAFAPREFARPRSASRLVWSVAIHAALVVAFVLAPLWYPDESLPEIDYVRALIYNPPPPPPPPLPKGSTLAEKPQEKSGQVKPPDPDVVVEPQFPEDPKPIEPERGALDPVGSATGSENGDVNGMEGGKDGGIVGGTLDGVVGGVIGGTGDGDPPVTDYDQPPRLLRQTRPVYPHEAFIKKIEGIVELDVIIEADGTVRRARVVRSIPLLDAEAIRTAKLWVFSPGLKRGRAVATAARIPITFRIF